ncbi:MAG: aminotransferase class V-fold PLP-dependent enzyme [Planctomyces sp.]|nr:aminotransferase class V-fold PLP-dependent enzyme [Planctomyces sp.]
MDVELLRTQMSVVNEWIYLDHAAVAPLPNPVADSMQRWIEEARYHGAAHWNTWRRQIEKLRVLMAGLLNAKPNEIALIRNTTEGVSIIANGWKWKPGDSVVVPSCEFPSNLYPWLQLRDQGVNVRIVEVQHESSAALVTSAIASACDSSTRIIALSWVDYVSGIRRDLNDLTLVAERCGARLFVDAIQGLGVIPLDVQQTPVDFLAADGHKWMLGPEGAGVLYVKESLLDQLNVSGSGWNSVNHAGDFSNPDLALRNSAARYEAGTYPAVTMTGLLSAMELITAIGIHCIWKQLQIVRDEFCLAAKHAGLNPLEVLPDEQSGIIACKVSQGARELSRSLRNHGIITNIRGGLLRISPHVYNTPEEAAEFLKCAKTTK